MRRHPFVPPRNIASGTVASCLHRTHGRTCNEVARHAAHLRYPCPICHNDLIFSVDQQIRHVETKHPAEYWDPRHGWVRNP